MIFESLNTDALSLNLQPKASVFDELGVRLILHLQLKETGTFGKTLMGSGS